MDCLFEGLPRHGVVLVPPSSPDYDLLLADIQRRTTGTQSELPSAMVKFMPKLSDSPRETSAVLLNKNEKTILGLQVDWVFETVGGRRYRHARQLISPRFLLLPFEWNDATRKRATYWQAILPSSKRYVGELGMVGVNSDVRPPAPEERINGGGGGGAAGGKAGPWGPDPVKQITVSIDGVFFGDGEFVGPNKGRLFERTVAEAEARVIVARVAREGHKRGLSAEIIFANIEKVTGAAPAIHATFVGLPFRRPDATTDDFQKAALQQLAFQFARRRTMIALAKERNAPLQSGSDDRIIHQTMAWADLTVPNLRKG